MKPSALSRKVLLETCFSDIPQQVSGLTLRNLSAASFALLGRLGSPMMQSVSGIDMHGMFEAVVLYIWIHSAPLETVCAVATAEDLPADEIRKLGFQIGVGDALGFLEIYKQCSQRMAAALSETEDEDSEPGKPVIPASALVSSPLLSMPSAAVVIPFASDTSSGTCPSNEPSVTSTPQITPMEPSAGGSILPDLMTDAQTSN